MRRSSVTPRRKYRGRLGRSSSASRDPLLNSTTEAIEVLDADWNVSYVNQAAADYCGKSVLELHGKNAWSEFPELVGSTLDDACRRAQREQVHIDLEFFFTRCAKWFAIHLHPGPRHLTLYATEITRRVAAETDEKLAVEIRLLNDRLQHALEETRTMSEALMISAMRQHELTENAERLSARLRRSTMEAHHRIKNNLQVIAALVELQIGERNDNDPDECLKRIYHHVRVLATLHDLLTHHSKIDSDAAHLGTQEILGRLIPMLEAAGGGRSINATIAEIQLPTQKAESLCLLVSECVSNAIKHANGPITVTLLVEGGRARLEVSDSGGGFPKGFDSAAAARTGLALLEATAHHDLQGDIRYGNNPGGGGLVTITFPIVHS
jgi:two-component sensor histidine kinase